MEPDVDRVRRVVGLSVFAIFFVSIVTGAVMFGRYVGEAIGTAYAVKGDSAADGLPMPPPGPPPQGPELSQVPKNRAGMPALKGAPARKSALATATKKS